MSVWCRVSRVLLGLCVHFIGKLAITLGPCLSLIFVHVPDSLRETPVLLLDHGLIVAMINKYVRHFVSHPRVPVLPTHC